MTSLRTRARVLLALVILGLVAVAMVGVFSSRAREYSSFEQGDAAGARLEVAYEADGARASRSPTIFASYTPTCTAADGALLEAGILCNGQCVDPTNDNNNCNGCGQQCPCSGSFNYCENCNDASCCIAKGSTCQYAPVGACCPGSTCGLAPSGTYFCQ